MVRYWVEFQLYLLKLNQKADKSLKNKEFSRCIAKCIDTATHEIPKEMLEEVEKKAMSRFDAFNAKSTEKK